MNEKKTLAGSPVKVGTYDADKHWSFIVFEGDNPQVVVNHTDCTSWKDSTWDEAWSILDSISFDRMLDGQMNQIISTIMNAKSNVLYFCGAGKDRTGVVSAIILRKLGFSDQVIIDDYMETKENLMGFLTAYVEEYPEVDINIIIPNEKNIKRVLEAI